MQKNHSDNHKTHKKATFAGGCFWCIAHCFEKIPGVIEAISGYIGGSVDNPSYEEVCSGITGHYEAVELIYDPAKVSFEELLNAFWCEIDPTDGEGQFADKGSQYKTAIFYHDDEQKNIAMKSKAELNASGIFTKPIVTEILPATSFYPAEHYHQDYYKKNALHYSLYRKGSGRDNFINKIWSTRKNFIHQANRTDQQRYCKLPPRELKAKLNDLQYHVTQECGTEKPFQNEYWNNKEPGIYVDIVTGEPLFSSRDKFDSGTGWPSFIKPLEETNIITKTNTSHSMIRTEVKSKHGDSHLGHVFEDGPAQTGLRYCINSAALRFIPVDKLEAEGYGRYKDLFDDK